MKIILSNTDNMYYTCVMYCHEKHRVRLYRKPISAVGSGFTGWPFVLLCFAGVVPLFAKNPLFVF
jgi:hypothetical protein